MKRFKNSVIESAYLVSGLPHILLAPEKSPGWQKLHESYDLIRKEIEEINKMDSADPIIFEKIVELKENEQIYGPILLGYPKTDPGDAVNRALERICPIKKEPITKWI